MMRKPIFKLAQNPVDRLWYVIGACGGGKYIPVSEGCPTRSEAHARLRLTEGAEKSARAELRGGSLAVHS